MIPPVEKIQTLGISLSIRNIANSQNLGTFVRVDNVNKNCRHFEGQIVDLDNR